MTKAHRHAVVPKHRDKGAAVKMASGYVDLTGSMRVARCGGRYCAVMSVDTITQYHVHLVPNKQVRLDGGCDEICRRRGDPSRFSDPHYPNE